MSVTNTWKKGRCREDHSAILLGVFEYRFLVNLVKWMPGITDEEWLCLFTKFTAAREECSEVQEPESCFSPEVVISCFPMEILLLSLEIRTQ